MGVGFINVVFVMDGWYSGVFYGFIVGYVVLEVVVGGLIVFVKDGDLIIISVEINIIVMDVDEEEMEKRRWEWKVFEMKIKWGVLVKYVKLVGDVSYGVVIDGL